MRHQKYEFAKLKLCSVSKVKVNYRSNAVTIWGILSQKFNDKIGNYHLHQILPLSKPEAINTPLSLSKTYFSLLPPTSFLSFAALDVSGKFEQIKMSQQSLTFLSQPANRLFHEPKSVGGTARFKAGPAVS